MKNLYVTITILLSIFHGYHANWFDQVENYKSIENGALWDLSFTAFERQWTIKLWPNTLFQHGSSGSTENIPTYWIGTLEHSRGSDVSVTLEADGSLNSAYIMTANGQQFRILSVQSFVGKQPEMQAELAGLKAEQLIIFDMAKQQRVVKRQSTPVIEESDGIEVPMLELGRVGPGTPSTIDINDTIPAPQWSQSLALYIDQTMIEDHGSFDRASQIVLSAMNDVNLILRHNNIREWSVRTQVKQVSEGVVTATNTLRAILDEFKSFRQRDIVASDPDCSLLVTGRPDLRSGTIGWAFVGSSCMKWNGQQGLSNWQDTASLCSGVVSDIGLYLYSIMAHELGHILGSRHVEDGSKDIMHPNVPLTNLGAARFTCASKTAMTAECAGNVKYSCDPNEPFNENDPAYANPQLDSLLGSTAGQGSIPKILTALIALLGLVL